MSDNREIVFEKYKTKGAYHWNDYFSSVFNSNVFVVERYKIILSLLDDVGICQSAKILDIGCGDGALSGLIYRKFKCDFYGIDTSKTGIQLARKKFTQFRYKGDFRLIDNYHYDFPDAFFDIIICADVIEHVREPLRMLSEIRRLIKVGGFAIIATPIRITEKPLEQMHIREWFPQEFMEMCTQAIGKPCKHVISHPVLFYELYTLPIKYIGKACRLVINILFRLGINAFSPHSAKRWHFNTMQTLLLKKEK